MRQSIVEKTMQINAETGRDNEANINLSDADGIQNFVKNATWKDILLHLVENNKLNIWDIDVGRIIHSYLDFIKKLKLLDLYVPANIIFAAAIMVRLKSSTISFEQAGQTLLETEDANIQRVLPEIDAIYPRMRLQPNKRITLDDLLGALNEAMAIEKKYTERPQSEKAPINIVFDIGIDERIKIIFDLIEKNLDSEKMTSFITLMSKFNEDPLLNLFVPLLYLMQKNKILLYQDPFFGDILIRSLNN